MRCHPSHLEDLSKKGSAWRRPTSCDDRKRSKIMSRTTLIVLAALGPSGLALAAGVPVFEVDPSWPKIPSQWKLGDASSVAVDAQNNVWVLHRPRTLPPNQVAMAAPPVLAFDTG